MGNMDKKDWVSVADKQQQKNMGFRGLTPDQQKAVTKLSEVLPEFLWELDECKDVWLSTVRKLESAMYDMKRNFEGLTEYQIGEMLNYGIDWDADGTWFDVSTRPKKAKK